MKSRIMHLTILVLTSTAFHAAAQTRPPAPPQNSFAPPPVIMGNPMQQMDTDKNGVISQAEFLKVPLKHFKEKDKNGDGVLSKEEFTAQTPMNMPPLGIAPQKSGEVRRASPPQAGTPGTSPQPSTQVQPRL